MKPYIVTYDLLKPETNEDYELLFAQLKGLGGHKVQLSVWLVSYIGTAEQLGKHLQSFIDKNDRLWIAELVQNHVWNQSFKGTSEWLMENPCFR